MLRNTVREIFFFPFSELFSTLAGLRIVIFSFLRISVFMVVHHIDFSNLLGKKISKSKKCWIDEEFLAIIMLGNAVH